MSNSSLAAVRAAFGDTQERGASKEQFTSNYYPFWNMKPGQRCVIRFLPDLDRSNPRGFLVEKTTHTLDINGSKKTVPCLTMYDEDCPICKVSQQFYKNEDKVNGKKYWKKRQYLAQCLVVEDPLPADPQTGETFQGKVTAISLGFQIYNIIKEAFADEDAFEGLPYSVDGGYDFVIKKTEQGEYSTYTTGTKFMNKQRHLTEEEISAADEGSVELKSLLPRHPTLEKVEALLNADLNGGDVEDSVPAKRTPTAAPAKATPNPFVDDDEVNSQLSTAAAASSGDSDDVDAMLATIRARRQAKSGS